MTLVLDASAALSWCFDDERTPDSLRVLDHVVDHGAVVPPLWRFAVGNGLLTAYRRERMDATTRMAMVEVLSALTIRVDPDSDRFTWTVTAGLADRHGLSIYDASYLEVALRLRLPLATRDKALAQAAAAAGIAAA